MPEEHSQVDFHEFREWIKLRHGIGEQETRLAESEQIEEPLGNAANRFNRLANTIEGFAWVISILAGIGILMLLVRSSFEGGIDGYTALALALCVFVELLVLLGFSAIIRLLGSIEENTRKSE
ncbi:hypothetical protein JYT16_01705 [Gemmatimonas aurantiaca]|nr:hypothetical protein [Gemmatimonas aurantiaca]